MLHKLAFVLIILSAIVISARVAIFVADKFMGRPKDLAELTLKIVDFVEKYWIPFAIIFFMGFLI